MESQLVILQFRELYEIHTHMPASLPEPKKERMHTEFPLKYNKKCPKYNWSPMAPYSVDPSKKECTTKGKSPIWDTPCVLMAAVSYPEHSALL